MQPIKIPGAHRNLAKPDGVTEDQCTPLWVEIGIDPVVDCLAFQSAWLPDEADRRRIAMGEPVFLTVIQPTHPMVDISTRQRPLLEHSKFPKTNTMATKKVRFFPNPEDVLSRQYRGIKSFYAEIPDDQDTAIPVHLHVSEKEEDEEGDILDRFTVPHISFAAEGESYWEYPHEEETKTSQETA